MKNYGRTFSCWLIFNSPFFFLPLYENKIQSAYFFAFILLCFSISILLFHIFKPAIFSFTFSFLICTIRYLKFNGKNNFLQVTKKKQPFTLIFCLTLIPSFYPIFFFKSLCLLFFFLFLFHFFQFFSLFFISWFLLLSFFLSFSSNKESI